MSLFSFFQRDPKPGDSAAAPAERRRDERFEGSAEWEATASLRQGPLDQEGRIRNVSLLGASLEFDGRLAWTVGAPAQVTLRLGDEELRFEGAVRRAENNRVAVQFAPPFPADLRKLEAMLTPQRLGRSLREIRFQGPDAGPLLRWFQGANDTHLFSWSDRKTGQVVQQQLIFLGRAVEWAGDEAVRTGLVDPGESREGVEWAAAELLRFDASADRSVLQSAERLVRASAIDETVRELFLRRIRSV